MNPVVRTQLSIMMFLQFFVWGAWYVTMGPYLFAIDFPGAAVGRAYSAAAWAAIISPFFVGMIADRFFSAERVLGVMHLLGGVLMYFVATIQDPWLFFIVLLGYTLTYMPTLALVNAVSFHHMSDPAKQFPSVRVLGTFGWIAAGITITIVGRYIQLPVDESGAPIPIGETAIPMKIAAACAILMGIYSFTLPHTPPKAAGQKASFREIIGADALRLMKERSFPIFVISSLLICIPLSFYYAGAATFLGERGMTDVETKMTFGQMSEVFFMFLMPFFLPRLGVKLMLLVGMLFWVARYFLFALGNADNLIFMYYLGILFHGICYDFFFVTGQIYVDKKAPAEIRASAQAFIALVTYGIGMAIGTIFFGYTTEFFTSAPAEAAEAADAAVKNWYGIWLTPAIMALVIAIVFAILFKDDSDGKKEA